MFEDGLGFDGSSIRGWQAINESDMLLLPQADTASIDPFRDADAVHDLQHAGPDHREEYTRDPRNVARKAVNYLKSTGIADTCFIGPEAEFFIFDDVRFDQTPNGGYFYHRQRRRPVEPRQATEPRASPTSATSCVTRKATSPCRPADH